MMLSFIALLCLAGGFIMLIALSIIDLRTRLLPNEMVLGFATLGIVFHVTTIASYVAPLDIFLGGFIGFTTLYLVRAVANYIYKEDALGLGDVKLIGAAGIWLGPDMIMMALCAGALCALIHGLIHGLRVARRTGAMPDFSRLQIPAGPGFAAGIILTGIYKFYGINLFGSSGLY